MMPEQVVVGEFSVLATAQVPFVPLKQLTLLFKLFSVEIDSYFLIAPFDPSTFRWHTVDKDASIDNIINIEWSRIG